MYKITLFALLTGVPAFAECRHDTHVQGVITERLAKHAEAEMRGDANGAAEVFAIDVILRSPGRETRGRAQQRDRYAENFKSRSVTSLRYVTNELFVCGDVAYENGSWEQTVVRAGQTEQSRSEYLNVWRRQRGVWYVHRGMFYRPPAQ